LVARSARQIRHDAIQMHGGIGMTEEYRLGALLKRLTAATACFGEADDHIVRHGDASFAAA